MMQKSYKIDADGFLIFGEDIFINDGEEIPEGYVSIYLDTSERGYFKPRFVNGEWVEGATQGEIDEITNVPTEPTLEEKFVQLEHENKLLKAQNAALVEQTEFHEEVLTEIILAINS